MSWNLFQDIDGKMNCLKKILSVKGPVGPGPRAKQQHFDPICWEVKQGIYTKQRAINIYKILLTQMCVATFHVKILKIKVF